MLQYRSDSEARMTAPWLAEFELQMRRLLPSAGYLVFEWGSAPDVVRIVCALNGGDEDWVVLTSEVWDVDFPPRWLSATGTCGELDEYRFDGFRIFVGSHA